MGKLAVLVTGAGALVGQGVLRCMRMEPDSKERYRILTGDPDARASGHWLGDAAYLLPVAVDPDYMTRVREIVRRERVDVLLVGTDVELGVFSEARPELEKELGVRVVVSDPSVVEIADDKLATARFLEEQGLPFPLTAPLSDRAATEALVSRAGFPLFAKPQRGARSRGVRVIRDRKDLDEAAQSGDDLIVQELLGNDDEEYTAGALVVEGEVGGVVVLRRDLRDGNTFRAYLEETGRFDDAIARIAQRLNPDGPCNFQFRVRNGEPVVFEINARFSGTTPLRAMFGFNEVTALLRRLTDGVPIPKPQLAPGAVFRVWADILVPMSQLSDLNAKGELDQPKCRSFPFINA